MVSSCPARVNRSLLWSKTFQKELCWRPGLTPRIQWDESSPACPPRDGNTACLVPLSSWVYQPWKQN